MDNLHEFIPTRNRARRDHRVNRHQHHKHIPPRKFYIEASIAVSRYGDSFGVAFVIYSAGQTLKRDFILLKPHRCLNEERAWLAGYMQICNWVEERFSDAGIYIVQPDAKARRAA